MAENAKRHRFKTGPSAIGTMKIDEFQHMAEFMLKDDLQRFQRMMCYNPRNGFIPRQLMITQEKIKAHPDLDHHRFRPEPPNIFRAQRFPGAPGQSGRQRKLQFPGKHMLKPVFKKISLYNRNKSSRSDTAKRVTSSVGTFREMLMNLRAISARFPVIVSGEY